MCEGQGQEPDPPQAQEAQAQAQPTPAPTRGVNEGCDFDHESISDENEVSVHITRGVDAYVDGYWRVDFLSGQFANINDARSWCVDLNRSITTDTYSVDLYSTMNTSHYVPVGAVDVPENIWAVNFLINKPFLGNDLWCSDVNDFLPVHHDDMQMAIWGLLDNSGVPSIDTPDSHPCLVAELMARALENTDYVPNCHEYDAKVAVMLIVDSNDGVITNQPVVSEIPLRQTDICDCGGGAFGDPHIKTWTGENYDFHGVCDLVLMSNPDFKNGLGIDIHIRSTRTRLWSYISSAAVRIGEDILEVVGGKNVNKFWINGVEHEVFPESNAVTLSGYQMSYKKVSDTVRNFLIDLGEGEEIIFKTWNTFVSISIKNAKTVNFGKSVGLMGSFETGAKVARDNKTILSDMNTFGQEWQVLESERKLFRVEEGPQQPTKCEIISGEELRRQLGESSIGMEDRKSVV